MKTKILSIIALAATLLSLTSCDEAWTPNTGDKTGQVSLKSLGVEVSTAESTVSRADVDLSDYIITIVNRTSGITEGQWTYSEMPEVFALPVGDYTVKVKSHTIQPAEWDKPYYCGEKDFSIEADKIAELGVVTCKFASLRVTVKFADELRNVMEDDARVSILAGENGTAMTFTPDETRSAYFEVVDASTTLIATFTGTVKGTAETLRKTYSDVKAGEHWIITFNVKEYPDIPGETGNISVDGGINVDASVTAVDVNGNVIVDEDVLPSDDRPGTEDPGTDPGPGTDPDPDPGTDPDPQPSDAITFASETLSFDTANSVDVTPAVVHITAANGIAHLVVNITTTSAGFEEALVEVQMPTTFDLAYPGSDKEVFESLGFSTGADVIGATAIDFDITQFVPLLGLYEGTHTFKITVTDQNNLQNSVTLTFIK